FIALKKTVPGHGLTVYTQVLIDHLFGPRSAEGLRHPKITIVGEITIATRKLIVILAPKQHFWVRGVVPPVKELSVIVLGRAVGIHTIQSRSHDGLGSLRCLFKIRCRVYIHRSECRSAMVFLPGSLE